MADFTYKNLAFNFLAKDVSSGAGTSYVFPTTLVDATGAFIGSSGNPLVVSGGGAGGSTVVTQPTAANLNAQVVGTAATGAVPVGNPLYVAGFDGTNVQPLRTNTSGNLQIAGNVASGAADSGNPVKIGGIYNSTIPTFTNGQRADIQLDAQGNMRAALTARTVAATDAISNSAFSGPTDSNLQNTTQRILGSMPLRFNGTTWDRERKPNLFARVASSAGSGNPAFLKNSAGDVTKFWGLNGAAITYIQFYNKASAPVIGTDTPVLTRAIAALADFDVSIVNGGAYFSTGIAYAFTTDAAATTGAAAAAITSFALFAA